MSDFVYFVAQFLTLNIAVSGILFLVLASLDKNSVYGKSELLIYSLGLGPAFTTLLAYYLFLLIPHKTSVFYAGSVFLFYTALLMGFAGRAPRVFAGLINEIKMFFGRQRLMFIFLAVVFSAFFAALFFVVKSVPIISGDAIEYFMQGKIFFNTKEILYQARQFDPETNFLYRGFHGFSFPIFSTISSLLNDIFNIKNDFYLRSLPGYYLFLISALFFIILYKALPQKKYIAAYGLAIFFLTPVAADIIYYHNLDSFRIFFLGGAIISLLKYIKRNESFSLILFGILGGFMANSHAMGAIFTPVLLISLYIFIKGRFIAKCKVIAAAVSLILVFGGVHYVFQTFWGDGWIIRVPTTNRLFDENPKICVKHKIIKNLPKKMATLLVDQNIGVYFSDPNAFKDETERCLPIWAKERGINSPLKAVLNGYLGQIFRFNLLGIYNWLIFLIFGYFCLSIRKRTLWEKALFFNYTVFFVIIAIKGFANYRYAVTLLPITQFLIIYYIAEIFRRMALNNSRVNAVFAAATGIAFIYWVYVMVGSARDLVNRQLWFMDIAKPADGCPAGGRLKDRRADAVIAESNMPKLSDEAMAEYIKALDLPKGRKLLGFAADYFYYYADKPIIYYWDDNLYTKKGFVRLIAKREDPAITQMLKTEYGCDYIIFNKKFSGWYNRFEEYINKNTRVVFETANYKLYKIT